MFVAYLFRSGISEVREIIMKIYRIVCRLGEIVALLDLPRSINCILRTTYPTKISTRKYLFLNVVVNRGLTMDKPLRDGFSFPDPYRQPI